MPTIDLSSNYRLISTQRTWQLQQRIQRKPRRDGDQREWESIRWYTSIESALRDSAEFCLRNSKSQDIYVALSEVKNLLAGLIEGLATYHQREIEKISAIVEKECTHGC